MLNGSSPPGPDFVRIVSRVIAIARSRSSMTRAIPNALPSAPSFSQDRPSVEIRARPRSIAPGRVGRTSASSPTARSRRAFARASGSTGSLAAFQQAHRFVDEADRRARGPAASRGRPAGRGRLPAGGDRRRPRRMPARRAASPRRSGRGSSEGSRGGSARPPGPDRQASARWHPRGSGRTRGTPAGR